RFSDRDGDLRRLQVLLAQPLREFVLQLNRRLARGRDLAGQRQLDTPVGVDLLLVDRQVLDLEHPYPELVLRADDVVALGAGGGKLGGRQVCKGGLWLGNGAW